MKTLENIGMWVMYPFIGSIIILLLLVFIKGLSEWAVKNIGKIDKAISLTGYIGGAAFCVLGLLVIIGSIILIFNRIF